MQARCLKTVDRYTDVLARRARGVGDRDREEHIQKGVRAHKRWSGDGPTAQRVFEHVRFAVARATAEPRAVDMPLRLDDADASPTRLPRPQPQTA